MSDPPYAPSSARAATEMLSCANILEYELVMDLGCGDARLLIEAAQRYGARGYGVELDPRVAAMAEEAVLAAGVGDLVEIERGSYFDTDLEDADVVLLYLNEPHMARLAPKLGAELSEGARVVTQHFVVPGWTPSAVSQEVRGSRIFVYQR